MCHVRACSGPCPRSVAWRFPPQLVGDLTPKIELFFYIKIIEKVPDQGAAGIRSSKQDGHDISRVKKKKLTKQKLTKQKLTGRVETSAPLAGGSARGRVRGSHGCIA